MWKQREPKGSSKYIPEKPDFKKKLANEGWLTKRNPSGWLNIPNAIEPFRKELSSKDAEPFERDNQRGVASMSKDFSIMTKHSSSAIASSIPVANTMQHSSGKELCPRIIFINIQIY